MRYNQNLHPPLLIVTTLQNFGKLAILAKKVLKIQKPESLIAIELRHRLLVVM